MTPESAGAALRLARVADAAAIAALCGELGYTATAADVAHRLVQVEASESQVVLVYDHAGDPGVRGWIEVVDTLRVESGRFGEITGLVVTESARGRGIGRQLVEAAASWCGARGLAKLRVRSNVTRTETHHFYAGLGFVENKRQVVLDWPLRRVHS